MSSEQTAEDVSETPSHKQTGEQTTSQSQQTTPAENSISTNEISGEALKNSMNPLESRTAKSQGATVGDSAEEQEK